MEISNYSKTKRLLNDVILFSISTFGSKILIFLLVPLYTAVLSTEEYGIADFITVTINLLYPILTLGIAESTLRFSLDHQVDNQKVLYISILFTLISTPVLFCSYPMINVIAPAYRQYVTIFIITYLLVNIHNTFSYYIKGIGKTKLFAIQGIIYTAVFVVLNILFLLVFKWGLNGYLWSTIISYIVTILIMFLGGEIYKCFGSFKVDISLMKDMLRYCVPMIPVLIGTLLNNNLNKYMIVGMVGMGESGIYSVAQKIPSLYNAVLAVFVQAWQISAIENKDDSNQSEYFTSIYRISDMVGVIGCMAIMIASKGLASFLFSADFYDGWRYVPMLMMSAMFMGNANIISAAYRAGKKTVLLFVSVAVGCGMNIVLNLILINYIGAIGAAIATAISSALLWFIRIIFVQKIFRIRIDVFKTTICYIILFVCGFIIMYEMAYWFVWCAVGLLIILVANFKEIIRLKNVIYEYLKKRFFKNV